MKLGLRYKTVYRYDEPVGFSPHAMRLFPRADRFHRVRRMEFSANGGATVRYARDVFDNVVAYCFFPEKMRDLAFELEIDLDLEEKDAFDFILDGSRSICRFAYEEEMAGLLAPYLQRQTKDALEIPGWKPPSGTERCGTVSALVALNQAMHEGIGYERREEGPALPPAETLRRGRGACRDVAVLLAEVLRAQGTGGAAGERLFARGGCENAARGGIVARVDGSVFAGRGLGGNGREQWRFLQSQFHRARRWVCGRRT